MVYTLTQYQEGIKNEWVRSILYQKMGHKMTVAHLTLKNGFEVVGVAGCEDPDNFDYRIGKHFALVDALSKVDPLISFLKQSTPEVLHVSKRFSDEELKQLQELLHGTLTRLTNEPFQWR